MPTRQCYTFVVWNTAANGSGTSYAPGANYTTNASVTLYAQWKVNTYTVKYDANGVPGVPIPASQEKNCGAALTLSSTTPTKMGMGYSFVSWNTAAGGNEISYTPGANYTNDASVTLYAQWICKTDNGPSVDYNKETYKSVVICGQTWMARNLNYSVAGSECYDGKESNCAIYGRLYNWATAMALPSKCGSNSCASQVGAKHKGICPPGWHIPSDAEWNTLIDNVERSQQRCTKCAGKHLKATNGWKDCSASGEPSPVMNSKSCLDSYGFSALPGGGVGDSFFTNADAYGYWWGATERNSGFASVRWAHKSYEFLGTESGNIGNKLNLFSVRCLKD